MNDDEQTLVWLAAATNGDSIAAQQLFQRVFQQLVQLARMKLMPAARRAMDEEDVALSAFDSFLRGAKEGRFPKLNDRHDLWKILVTIVLRKAHGQNKREGRQKRGGGDLRGESVFVGKLKNGDPGGIEQFATDNATPEMAAMLHEELEARIGLLADPKLRELALLKLEGYTNLEIASKFDCSLRSIERKLELIRDKWTKFEA